MRGLQVLALAAVAPAILFVTMWRAMADTNVGKPASTGLSIDFRPEQGDYALYTESGSVSGAEFTAEATVLSMDKDLMGRRRIGFFSNVKSAMGLEDKLWRYRTSLHIPRVPPMFVQQRGGPEPPLASLGILLDAPWPLEPGQEWETQLSTDTAMRARVMWRVTGEDTISGFRCLRIDVTPKEPLPYELTDWAIMDGFRPDKVVLTSFAGQVWVDEKTGWVVKMSQAMATQEVTGARTSESSMSLSRLLKSFTRLAGAQYRTLSEQFNRLDYIQSFVNQNDWYGSHNQNSDSDTGERMLSEFSRKWPKNRFASFLPSLRQQLAAQRGGSVVAEFHERYEELNGKPAPAFRGTYLDRKPFTPLGLRGRPAVMLFLNPGSDYLRYRTASIESFAKKWQRKGVRVVAIAPQGMGRAVVETFVKRNHVTFPFVMPDGTVGGPLDQRLYNLYQIGGPKVAIVLDADGNVRHYRADLYPEEVEPLLKELLRKRADLYYPGEVEPLLQELLRMGGSS